ncbi:MAG: hypothetical protein KDB27_23245 [Planctomycetales bacterium]|nr:hypothetical protein [Planctomycetales bacterium]
MPGWYKNIKGHLDDGSLHATAIVEEQHGERTSLFNQWKELDKIETFVDSLNRLDVAAVPIVLFVDEFGIIRKRNPKPSEVDDFLEYDFENDPSAKLIELPQRPGDQDAIDGKLDQAIAAYREHLKQNPEDARAQFRLGVCYRKRFDGMLSRGNSEDFVLAVQHWQTALRLNPNQYIWRRRLQQYGPVLSKPYPFYDWVDMARNEIVARGESPRKLLTEPTGAELIGPAAAANSERDVAVQEPDPTGRVHRDRSETVVVRTAIIHSTEKKDTARVHVMLRPSAVGGYDWNNEAEPVRLWIRNDQPFKSNHSLVTFSQPKEESSSELRRSEFEVSWSDSDQPKPLEAYVVYHLCNKQTGQCVFWRQDISIDVVPTEKGQP